MIVCFFFFKQKTAYEVRISDWSSDVCSSDLAEAGHRARALAAAGVGRLVGTARRLPATAFRHHRARLQFAGPLQLDPAARRTRHRGVADLEIGRASWRERVCQYV